MNTAGSLFSQQIGLSTWKNYDMVIRRLICKRDEEFRWIFPDDIFEGGGAVDPPIFACKFSHVKGYENILALANEDGRIAIYDVERKGSRYGGSAHNNAIFDIAWMSKGLKLVSASGDHTAALFDVQNGDIVLERVFHGHSRSLKSVACRKEDCAVFATGGRDGRIIMWDVRVPRSQIMCTPDICLPWTHHQPSQVTKIKTKTGKMQDVVSGSSSVTGLVFQDYNTLISCGAGDGLIKVWDMRKTFYAANKAPIPKHTLPYAGGTWRNGYSHLLLNSTGNRLYVNSLDNVIYCYNVATYEPQPVMKYTGHKNSTFYVKSCLSPDEMYLLSGSSDNSAYIWRTNSSQPIARLDGHEAEVTCVAWCENRKTVLVTCSDDLRHKIWRVGPEVVPEHLEFEVASRISVPPIGPEVVPEHLELEVASRISVPPKQQDMVDTPSSRKRGIENLFTLDYDAVCTCQHVRCRYCDEYIVRMNRKETKYKELANYMKKKLKIDSRRKRKLFGNLDQNVPSTSTVSSEDEADPTGTTKRPRLDCDSSSSDENSVTDNLPNFVVDGSAPHINISPVKKQEKDWLTQLRMTRMSTNQIQELSKPSPSKVPKVDGKSPRSKNSTKAADGSASPSQSRLLKFFKVTNNTSPQCRAKSPNLVTSSSPKSQSSQ